MAWARTLLVVTVLGLATLVCGTLAMLLALVDWRKGSITLAEKLWARSILLATGLEITIEGRERLQPGRQYIYVANHCSQLDIALVLIALPGTIVFLAKRELFRIPFFGWSIWAAGMISVDRKNPARARRSLTKAVRQLRTKRISVLLFPEGTRSRDGQLLPFKKGGFRLAARAGLPLVPVTIKGTFRALPPGAGVLTKTPIRVTIGEPIETEGLTEEDRDRLLAKARGSIEALLARPHRDVEGG